jgi:hypothetical protein
LAASHVCFPFAIIPYIDLIENHIGMKGFILLVCICFCSAARAQDIEADTMINQIVLKDAKSFITKFGLDTAKIKYYLNYGGTLPQLNLINKSGDQKLTLILHPGSEQWAFSEFKVSYSYTREEETEGVVIEDKIFETGMGIKLWTRQAELIKKFGQPTQIKYDKGDPIYKYTITDRTSKLFKNRDHQVYFAYYKLKYGKVIEFHFGFEETP